jgi:hypothetical protein
MADYVGMCQKCGSLLTQTEKPKLDDKKPKPSGKISSVSGKVFILAVAAAVIVILAFCTRYIYALFNKYSFLHFLLLFIYTLIYISYLLIYIIKKKTEEKSLAIMLVIVYIECIVAWYSNHYYGDDFDRTYAIIFSSSFFIVMYIYLKKNLTKQAIVKMVFYGIVFSTSIMLIREIIFGIFSKYSGIDNKFFLIYRILDAILAFLYIIMMIKLISKKKYLKIELYIFCFTAIFSIRCLMMVLLLYGDIWMNTKNFIGGIVSKSLNYSILMVTLFYLYNKNRKTNHILKIKILLDLSFSIFIFLLYDKNINIILNVLEPFLVKISLNVIFINIVSNIIGWFFIRKFEKMAEAKNRIGNVNVS